MKTLYFMLFALTLLCGCNVKKDEHCGEDQNIKTIKLKQLLEQRQLDAALVLSDSLIVEYPESPEFYFMRGWIFDQKEDSLNKMEAFTRARELYDKRIKKNNSWNDAVNRAFITQILFGMEAFRKEVDSLKVNRNNDYIKDPGSDIIFDSIVYENMKKDLFKGNSIYVPEK